MSFILFVPFLFRLPKRQLFADEEAEPQDVAIANHGEGEPTLINETNGSSLFGNTAGSNFNFSFSAHQDTTAPSAAPATAAGHGGDTFSSTAPTTATGREGVAPTVTGASFFNTFTGTGDSAAKVDFSSASTIPSRETPTMGAATTGAANHPFSIAPATFSFPPVTSTTTSGDAPGAATFDWDEHDPDL